MKKLNFFKVFLAAAFLAAGVWAQNENNVPYLDAAGVSQTANGVRVISAANVSTINELNGWYLVRGVLSRNTTLYISNEAHIILEDGSDFTVTSTVENANTAGIGVPAGNSLSIYAQSSGNDMGKLTATATVSGSNSNLYAVGIGSNNGGSTISINGGIITATAEATNYNGNAYLYGIYGNKTTINNGIIVARNSGNRNYYTGNGIYGTDSVTINAGTVTAIGSDRNYGRGIQGGRVKTDANAVVFANGVSGNPSPTINSILFDVGIGTGTFFNGSSVAATFPSQGITATWTKQNGKNGISYYGNKSGFIEVPNITLIERNLVNNISYIDENGITKTANNVTLLDETNIGIVDNLGGWYLVRGNLSRESGLNISGESHIILENGSVANFTNDINVIGVYPRIALSIYAQSSGDNMGKLTANSLGINSNTTINGGKITVYNNLAGDGTLTLNGDAVVFAQNVTSSRTLNGGILFVVNNYAYNYYNNNNNSYTEGTSVAATYPTSGISAKWKKQDDKIGIAYETSNKNGFIELPNVKLVMNNVPYIDADGEPQTANNVTIINAGNIGALTYNNPNILSGWFLVCGNLNITGGVSISGSIILEDNSNFTIKQEHYNTAVSISDRLSVYAQSTVDNMGKLTAITSNYYGISGNIAVNGGMVTAIGNNYGINGALTLNGAGIVFANSIDATITHTGGILFVSNVKTVLDGTPVKANFPAEDITATWMSQNGKNGISYESGEKSGFIEVPELTLIERTLLNNIAYIDEKGATKTANNVTLLDKTNIGAVDYFAAGWYLVRGDSLTRNKEFVISGDAHIILENGCDLTVRNKISVPAGNNLTIYAQSSGNNMGKLTALYDGYNSGSGRIGIDNNNITINGGNISVSNRIYGNNITINGGNISSVSSNNGIYGNNITINGGTITMTNYNDGITGDNITISGGTVTTGNNGINGALILDGNAIVFVYSLNSEKSQTLINGILFTHNGFNSTGNVVYTGTVYGNVEIKNGDTFTIPQNRTLTIPSDATLTNNGTINVCGRIIGIVVGNQPMQCDGVLPYLATNISNDVQKSDSRYGIRFAKNIVSDKLEITDIILPDNENVSEIKAIIYDNTGNIVYSKAERGKKAVWNLTNSNGRTVANGTYLVIVEAKSYRGKSYWYSAKIGVKR